ncbi:hypothetical protein [Niallia taxi]|uniref:hypothetical protein n=1 Tax=Niallia taxi TaxID=2499688 RepID=UPI002E20ABB0|nr:hypothetical protein [Niallia taxi]
MTISLIARLLASAQGQTKIQSLSQSFLPFKVKREIQLFYTDRGSEFKNQLINQTLAVFQIDRSLKVKGFPYNNAVAESTFTFGNIKIIGKKHVSILSFHCSA